MSCQARILGEELMLLGIEITLHKTRECGAPAAKKITVDDGDAYFQICMPCFRRFLTKGSKIAGKDTWLGWFDCAYPPHARVEFSPWYYQQIRANWDSNQTEEMRLRYKDQVFPPSWCKEYVEKIHKAVLENSQPSAKNVLKEEIAAIEAWMKGEGRLKFKEQPKKLKELMRLRAELKML